jgi:hypothetical protein
MFKAAVNSDELYEVLRNVFLSDADLLAEVDELFFGEDARYETSGVVNYVFTIAPTAADGTNCQHVAVVCRDKNERGAILAAPEKYGFVERVSIPSSLHHEAWYVKCNVAVYFLESGLFNGLGPIQIKFFSSFRAPRGCGMRVPRL